MAQDECWMAKYNEVVEFIESNHRNPSRHRLEEHDMLNWLKATRKRMNAGELKELQEISMHLSDVDPMKMILNTIVETYK